MSLTNPLIVSALVCAATLGAAGPAAATRKARPAPVEPYPTNVCVGAKQKAAGDHCRRVLRAWAYWDRTGDAGGRDRKIVIADAELEKAWAKAEGKAAGQGVDCADTTLTSSALEMLVSSASGAIVAAVNQGLDFGDPVDKRCGERLLQASAKKCASLLELERNWVRNLAKDPQAVRLNAGRGQVAETFTGVYNRQRRKGCSTAATAGGLEALIDDLVADVVTQTTVSPSVPNTQYMTISPHGTTQYLGKAITPGCMNGTPYQFFARRGSVNKLVVYYQGGGACWDGVTCGVPVCDVSVTPGDNPNNFSSGFADLSDPRNPFRDWNAVFVSYCSCDVHFGDAAQDYPRPALPSLHVEHRGYHNSRIVEKWAREHFVNPEEIFVTGTSAGAYGAWFNAPLHHDVWPASQFDVLADAGNGVITPAFLQNEFNNWNFRRNIPPTIPGVVESIDNGTGIVGYTKAVTDFFPRTRWAHYTTAYDGGSGGQTGFYNLMLNPQNPIGGALNWWQGSCAFNERMRAQAFQQAGASPANYRYYIGTGSRHGVWGHPKVYSDTTGGVPLLVDWVSAMLVGGPGWTNVEATDSGLLLPGDPRPPTIPTPPFLQVGPDVKVVCSGGGSPSGAFLD